MQISEIIRAAIPGAMDEVCEYVLWERTAYPFAKLTARDIYRAASRWKRARDAGNCLCEYCDRLASRGSRLCPSCANMLAR